MVIACIERHSNQFTGDCHVASLMAAPRNDSKDLTKPPRLSRGGYTLSFQFYLCIDQQQAAFMAVPGRVVVQIPAPQPSHKPYPLGKILCLFCIRHSCYSPHGGCLSSRIPVQPGPLGFCADALPHFLSAVGADEAIVPFFHGITPFSFILSLPKGPFKKTFFTISHKNCISLL